MRHDGGRCKRREEGGRKGMERAAGKVAGDECVFIPGPEVGLADEVGSVPDAASSGGRSPGR